MRVFRIHSNETDTPIHAKNIGEQKIGEEHSAMNVPAKSMTRRNFRNPYLNAINIRPNKSDDILYNENLPDFASLEIFI